AAGGTPVKFGGLFNVTLNLIVIVLLGGKVKPDPVPLIGKVPPTGTGAAAVSSKFSVFSFELRVWFDLLTSPREALWSAPTSAALLIPSPDPKRRRATFAAALQISALPPAV